MIVGPISTHGNESLSRSRKKIKCTVEFRHSTPFWASLCVSCTELGKHGEPRNLALRHSVPINIFPFSTFSRILEALRVECGTHRHAFSSSGSRIHNRRVFSRMLTPMRHDNNMQFPKTGANWVFRLPLTALLGRKKHKAVIYILILAIK